MVNVAAVVLAAAVAAAESAPPGWPVPGEKVRLTTHTGTGRDKGVVVAADAEALTVSLGTGKPPLRVPLASLERLEVARGRRSAAKEGAITGGIVGGAFGIFAISVLSAVLCDNSDGCDASAQAYLGGAGIFGAGGAGLGALVGLAIKKDRWERVPVDRVRVGLEPVRGGAGVGVSLAWGDRKR
jgi:hypothetical protein